MENQPTEGLMFSRNYLIPAKKLADSARARHRILQLINRKQVYESKFVELVEAELGIEYPNGSWGYTHSEFFKECQTRDFLSSITLLVRCAMRAHEALDFCRRVFREEHLKFKIDDRGGVHFEIDEAFESSSKAAISNLEKAPFVAARHALETALSELSGANPSGKALIRGVFEATESAFLTVIGDASVNRMNAQAIDQKLKPILLGRYSTLPDKEDRVKRVLEIIKHWANAAHPFRHGASLEQVHEAPMSYATLLAHQGMAALRFIISESD